MTLTLVRGDPTLTSAQILAFGSNARGRTEVDPLTTRLLDQYPTAFATFAKQCRNQRVTTGDLWLWRETRPQLGFMVVRASSVGATRMRYVEEIALKLARDYRRENISSIAIAPLADSQEWPHLIPVLAHWLDNVSLPCYVYEQYLPGVVAESP